MEESQEAQKERAKAQRELRKMAKETHRFVMDLTMPSSSFHCPPLNAKHEPQGKERLSWQEFKEKMKKETSNQTTTRDNTKK